MGTGWAVVTGASSGIGWAFARELASRGYSVLAVARRRERLDKLVREAAASGGRIEGLVADLQAAEGLAAVVRRAGELGEIDLLVNNAGVATGGDFVSSRLDAELGSIRLNVDALVTLTHELLPAMVRRGRGNVVNIASVVAFQALPHFATYAATKAFVLSFTEALAEELRGTGVKALAVCPGAVRSELDMFSRNEGLLGRLPSLTPEKVVTAALGALDIGRVTTIVGWTNRALNFMNRLAPRWVIRRTLAAIAHPPSAAAPAAPAGR